MNIHFICYCCSFTLLVHLVVMAHHMVKFWGTTLSRLEERGTPIDLIYSVDICDIIISVIDLVDLKSNNCVSNRKHWLGIHFGNLERIGGTLPPKRTYPQICRGLFLLTVLNNCR